MAAYTAIDDPEAYFQVKLYTGTGSELAVTLDGDTDMQPDFVWAKNRGQSEGHNLFDSVRGATKFLKSNNTDAEGTGAETLKSFDSDGFTVGTDADMNTSSELNVAWCWKESATAGFDIVGFAGNATNSDIAHSLSAVPEMMITKSRENAENWGVYHQAVGNTHASYLNTTVVPTDEAAYYQDTTPTSSVFTVGTADATNDDADMIAYLFAPKQGFSKFGSYPGNGNADGPFIYTGFKPAFVMFKETDSTSPWSMFDTKRDVDNVTHHRLEAQANNTEYTGSEMYHDILSNGFKLRTTDAEFNTSGGTYIYMAFAEQPFVNSNGVPCNAR